AISAGSAVLDMPLGQPNNAARFVSVFHIDQGNWGNVRLDGLNFAVVGEFMLPSLNDMAQFQFAAAYYDSRANAQQLEALRAICRSGPFGVLGNINEERQIPITFQNLQAFGRVGSTCSARVGGENEMIAQV